MKNIINIDDILGKCKDDFEKFEKDCEINSVKVLKSFIENKVGEHHFCPSTGYGYGNSGREILNKVFAQSFGAEGAFVSENFVSGTHAISTVLFSLATPFSSILFATGKPYDTLNEVIFGNNCGSLLDLKVKIYICDFLNDETFIENLKNKPDVVYIQRSKGYTIRNSLSICDIKNLIIKIRKYSYKSKIIIDNCYGEFVDIIEPTSVGADVIVGSLIKNPGAGIAPSGGYIAGNKEIVELCEQKFLAPGLHNMGSSDHNRELFMGLFYAPRAVCESLKTVKFAKKLLKEAGFEVYPKNDFYNDIIACICLKTEKNLKSFCKEIQKHSPVESFVIPEPWDMPGYDYKVIMSSGGFISGSSIELSADAPIKQPYNVWLQGGTNFYTSKFALIESLKELE